MSSKPKILITEDDSKLLKVMTGALDKAGYEIVTASGLKEMDHKLEAFLPDVLLLDVVLPDGNALERIHDILKNPQYSNMYILLMSGQKLEDREVLAALEAGVLDYLMKPLSLQALKARLHTLFRLRQIEEEKGIPKDRYAFIRESEGDLIFVVNHQNSILAMNKTCRVELDISDQYTPSLKELVYSADLQDLKKNIQLLHNTSEPQVREMRLVTTLHAVVPVRYVLSSIHSGKNTEVMVLARDKRPQKSKQNHSRDSWVREEQNRERAGWESMTETTTRETGRTYDASFLQDTNSNTYQEVLELYRGIMEKSLEGRIYKTEFNRKTASLNLAEKLGFYQAGPRDLVRLHIHYFENNVPTGSPAKDRIIHEESRLVLLEVMGYLASYYRNRL